MAGAAPEHERIPKVKDDSISSGMIVLHILCFFYLEVVLMEVVRYLSSYTSVFA